MIVQSRPIIHFTKGAHRFEVYPNSSDKQVGYLGFYDGQLSAISSDHYTVTQMLLRRHGPMRRSTARRMR